MRLRFYDWHRIAPSRLVVPAVRGWPFMSHNA